MDFFEDLWGEEPGWARDDLPDGADNNNDGNNGKTINLGAQHVLMLFDCRQEMFETFDDNNDPFRTPMNLALRVAKEFLMKRIRDTVVVKTGKRNGVGILLYNTKLRKAESKSDNTDNNKQGNNDRNNKYKNNNNNDDDDDSATDIEDNKDDDSEATDIGDGVGNDDDSSTDIGDNKDDDSEATDIGDGAGNDDVDFVNAHELIKLAPPGVENVKTISSILDGDRDLKNEYGQTNSNPSFRVAPLQTALENSIEMFRTAKCVKPYDPNGGPVDSKSIWIFTNEADPYPNSNSSSSSSSSSRSGFYDLVQNVANDAKEQKIEIIVWPMMMPKNDNNDNGGNNEFFNYDLFYNRIVTSTPFPTRLSRKNGNDNDDDNDGNEVADDADDWLDIVSDQWKKLRRAFYCPLLFPDWRDRPKDDPSIMVDWYRCTQAPKKPTTVKVDQYTMRETVKVRQLVDDQGNIFASFGPHQDKVAQQNQVGLERIRYFQEFGGEMLPFSKSDLEKLRRDANPTPDFASLILLGFRPKDSIPWYHTMGATYLIYPNDDVVEGSVDAFVHLHDSMLRKNVLAIGEVVHRVQWGSRLVAMYPQKEEFEDEEDDNDNFNYKMDDDNNNAGGRNSAYRRQKIPPGMLVVTLPFEDDIRDLEPDAAMLELLSATNNNNNNNNNNDDAIVSDATEAQRAQVHSSDFITADQSQSATSPAAAALEGAGRSIATEEAVEAAAELIEALQIQDGEIGEDFENVALSKFIDYLEQVAFDITPEENEKEYDLEIDENAILTAASRQIEAFNRLLPDDEKMTTKKKNNNNNSSSNNTRKRQKLLVPDDSGIDWDHLYRTDSLHECKVPQLKSYLRSVGEPVGGNKATLLKRVEDHLRENIAQSSSG